MTKNEVKGACFRLGPLVAELGTKIAKRIYVFLNFNRKKIFHTISRPNYPIFATFGRYVDNKIFHDAKILLLKHFMKKRIKIFQGCMVLVTVFAILTKRLF